MPHLLVLAFIAVLAFDTRPWPPVLPGPRRR